MSEFQARHKIKRLVYSKVMVFLLLVMIFFVGKGVLDVWGKERESAQNAAEAAKALKNIQDRETFLSSEINRLSTSQGVEEEIRSKYSVAKPGEELIVIVGTTSTTTTTATKGGGFWDHFMSLFR